MCRLLHTPSLEAVCFAPPGAGVCRSARQKLTPAQRAGLAFQRKLSKALPFGPGPSSGNAAGAALYSAPWLAFRDRNGAGLAQPDAFVCPLPDGSVLLLEAKLKLTAAAVAEARRQVERLYLPLLAALFPGAAQRAAIVGRYLGGEAAVPLAELGWADLRPEPLLTFWNGQRSLAGLGQPC